MISMRAARLVVSGMAVVLAACGQRPSGLFDVAREPVGDAAKTGRVVCDGTSTDLRHGAVRTRIDGVHLRIVNRSTEPLLYEWNAGRPDGLSATESFYNPDAITETDAIPPGGTEDLRYELPPGPTSFRCFTVADATDDDGVSAEGRLLQVVNPDGAWIPPRLDCEPAMGGTMSYEGFDPSIPPKGPRKMAEEQWGPPRPGDEIVAAGYPKGDERWFVLVRDGRRINSASYLPADEPDMKGYWLPGSFESCSVE